MNYPNIVNFRQIDKLIKLPDNSWVIVFLVVYIIICWNNSNLSLLIKIIKPLKLIKSGYFLTKKKYYSTIYIIFLVTNNRVEDT